MKKFKIFINQFNSPLIYILFVACFISFYLKEFIDGFIILFVIFINGIVGFIQEIRADDALEALKKMSSPHCYIKENGKKRFNMGSYTYNCYCVYSNDLFLR